MTQQLVTEFQYDDTHLELVRTLREMTLATGTYYQLLSRAGGRHRWPLVKFQAWDERRMNGLIRELAMAHEDEDVAVARMLRKVTSF